MTLMKFGVLIALLVVACFVGSAQEGFPVEFPMSTEIGNTAFSFNVPYSYDDERIRVAYNTIVDDGYVYSYTVASVQPASNSTMAFVALSYFKNGKPPLEVEKAEFLKSFENAYGKVNGEGRDTVIAGYSAVIWSAQMPYTDNSGLLAHMPAKLAYIDVDPYRTLSVVAQDPVFNRINQTLKLDIKAPVSAPNPSSIRAQNLWIWSS